jgi:hypothetical protein
MFLSPIRRGSVGVDTGAPDTGGPDTPTDPRLMGDKNMIAFGAVVQGMSSAPAVVTVTNVGGDVSGALTVALAGDASVSLADDLCGGQGLPPGESCTVSVRLQPSAPGAVTATLLIVGLPGGTLSVSITGNGIAPGALTITPPTHAFGDLQQGLTGDAQRFTINNTGGAATGALQSALSGSDGVDFAIEDDECVGKTLAPAGTCTVAARFVPKTAGGKSASLTVTGDPGGTAIAALSGTGLRPASLSIDPERHDFGGVVRGTSGAPVTFTIHNTGEVPATVPTIEVTGTHAVDFAVDQNSCTTAIAPDGTCQVAIRFAPSDVGARQGRLGVLSGIVTTGADLQGNGLAPGNLEITPSSEAFGSTLVGMQGASRGFVIKNAGGGMSGALAISVSGSAAGDFSVTADGCSGNGLVGGGTCNVTLTFTPGAAGARAASLQASGMPGGSVVAALSGTGLRPANLSLSPAGETFGSLVVGQSSERTFTVSNTGEATAGTLALDISGGNVGDFMILPASAGECTTSTALGPGQGCAFRVRFTPTAVGARASSVQTAANPGGMKTATLAGTGLAQGQLSASASSRDFGGVEVGASSDAFTWTITNVGGVATGLPALGNSNPSDFLVTNGCGAAIAPGAMCTIQVVFRPLSGGNRTGTIGIGADPGGMAQLSVSGKGQYRLNVTMGGNGRGRVTSSPAGIDCDGTCSALFDVGTLVTLMARTQNGDDMHFVGWEGAFCNSAGAFHDCAHTMATSNDVVANFRRQDTNLVFVGSEPVPANLGALERYDQVCNTLASKAGINNTGGNAFLAWLSDVDTSAASRLSKGQGWRRMDGRPFARALDNLLNDEVLNPIVLDERGSPAGTNFAFTGTGPSGKIASHCLGWTAGTPLVLATSGQRFTGPTGWTSFGSSPCSTPARLYCFGTTKATLPKPSDRPGKRIYLTDTPFTVGGGIDDADKLCDSSRPATAANPVAAFLATTDRPAAKVLDLDAEYVTPWGEFVGTGSQLAKGLQLGTGIWQTGDAGFQPNQQVFTGSTSPDADADEASTCSNWKDDSGARGVVGFSSATQSNFWNGTAASCSVPRRLYCVEL